MISVNSINNWNCKVPKGVISCLINNGVNGDLLDKSIVFVSWFNSLKYLHKDKYLGSIYLNSHNKVRRILGKDWYNKVLVLLLNLKIVSIEKNYSKGHHCRLYSLNEKYLNDLWSTYRFTSRFSKFLFKRIYKLSLDAIYRDKLAKLQYEELLNITAPRISDVVRRGIELIQAGYTYKGKKLAFSGNDRDNYYYVTDAVDQLSLYWSDGKLIEGSIYCGNENCKRVATAFNLLPKWVREMFTVKGKPIKGVDYSCLHPNIVASLVDDGDITHDKVSKYLNIPRHKAKIEHLSFFNRPVYGMYHKGKKCYFKGMCDSPLFKYYKDKHPDLLEYVLTHKKQYGYKGLCRLLFSIETDIALYVCQQCKKLGIRCFYVYDGFYTAEDDVYILKEVMEEALKRFKVRTYAVIE